MQLLDAEVSLDIPSVPASLLAGDDLSPAKGIEAVCVPAVETHNE